jgi:hypothetical protein
VIIRTGRKIGKYNEKYPKERLQARQEGRTANKCGEKYSE